MAIFVGLVGFFIGLAISEALRESDEMLENELREIAKREEEKKGYE